MQPNLTCRLLKLDRCLSIRNRLDLKRLIHIFVKLLLHAEFFSLSSRAIFDQDNQFVIAKECVPGLARTDGAPISSLLHDLIEEVLLRLLRLLLMLRSCRLNTKVLLRLIHIKEWACLKGLG